MEGYKIWRFGLSVLVATVMLFAGAADVRASFIYGISPPTEDPGPPGGNGDPGPPDLPPPGGEGETPPGDPPIDPPPPSATPEPASIITALLGAGLTVGYALRRRKK